MSSNTKNNTSNNGGIKITDIDYNRCSDEVTYDNSVDNRSNNTTGNSSPYSNIDASKSVTCDDHEGVEIDSHRFNIDSENEIENELENEVGLTDRLDNARFAWVNKDYLKANTGLILLIIAELFNSIMIVSTKLLETNPSRSEEDTIKPLQVLLVRMSITYLFTLIYMYINKVPHAPFGEKSIRHLLIFRGCTGFIGVFGLYFSLMYLTISDAILIRFIVPTITVFLAFIVLRERFSFKEMVGSIISFCGVILIIRPKSIFGKYSDTESALGSDGENDNPVTSDYNQRLVAIMVALFGVVGASNVYIIIRYIGKRAHAVLSVAYFSLLTTIVSFLGILTIPSMRFQAPRDLKEWLLMGNLGLCGFIYQLLLTMGIQRERAARGSLISYLQLLFAIMWDVSLWDKWPNFFSWMGMVVIISSTIWVIRAKQERQEKQHDLEIRFEGICMEDVNANSDT